MINVRRFARASQGIIQFWDILGYLFSICYIWVQIHNTHTKYTYSFESLLCALEIR